MVGLGFTVVGGLQFRWRNVSAVLVAHPHRGRLRTAASAYRTAIDNLTAAAHLAA